MARALRNQNSIGRRGLMLVLSSPSGAGKTTLSRFLLSADRNVELSISVTTRSKRRGEINGRDYHFIDSARFDEMVRRSELLEWAEVFGHRYGTRRAQDSKTVIESRMAKASDEMSHWAEYDYVIVNRDKRHAFAELRAILAAERLKLKRQVGMSDFVRRLQAKL